MATRRSSPWGTVRSTQRHFRGVNSFSTGDVKGLMIGKGTATKHFSPEALAYATFHGSHFWFEGEVGLSVALFDSDQIRDAYCLDHPQDYLEGEKLKSNQTVKRELLAKLSLAAPSYLQNIGIEPLLGHLDPAYPAP